jgi:hypothetical protein
LRLPEAGWMTALAAMMVIGDNPWKVLATSTDPLQKGFYTG